MHIKEINFRDSANKFKNEFRIVALPLALLLVALLVNKHIAFTHPRLWIVIPVGIAILLSHARFSEVERPVVRLWQFLGLLKLLGKPMIDMKSMQ